VDLSQGPFQGVVAFTDQAVNERCDVNTYSRVDALGLTAPEGGPGDFAVASANVSTRCRVGMLRLRKRDRYAILPAALSMTSRNLS
jgi:hypothetical protein